MKLEKDEKGKYVCVSKIKDVVYSIKESDGLFYVGLTRLPNKENDFLSKITVNNPIPKINTIGESISKQTLEY